MWQNINIYYFGWIEMVVFYYTLLFCINILSKTWGKKREDFSHPQEYIEIYL